ncbi:MAG: AIR carboxylase family protein [Deltaproteobacteria bacterium]|nr:AIR carboxylase family protein [Deltaproteobacteria bacterium]
MECLSKVETPQLQKLHRGKVRDSFRVDGSTRLIIVTDRLSAFDRVLDSPIPRKGEVLNQLSGWWFERTRDLVDNHLIKTIGPSGALVREASPVKIEMVVRGFITGSMWRGYAKGERAFSGHTVPDGLTQNQRLERAIVTPTTKEKSDRPITPLQIVAEGWTTAERYEQMQTISLQLFERGRRILAERGLLLVDTKYEFGIIEDRLCLIDELHTPDSSRFWDARAHESDPASVDSLDKEFVRRWLLARPGAIEAKEVVLPGDVVAETSRRYLELFHRVTERQLPDTDEPVASRQLRSLVGEGLVKDAWVAVIMGSPADRSFCESIAEQIRSRGVYCELRVMSAHKNGERILEVADEYNHTLEPGVVVAVAGRSNGLGGALAANLNVLVINAPPFKDQVDILTNVGSSLMMPSKTPAVTAIGADNAARAAVAALNLSRLRRQRVEEITQMKAELLAADGEARGRR